MLAEHNIDTDEPVRARPTCAIDIAVGSSACVTNHRLDITLSGVIGHGPRLRFNRYYFDAEPPVAVDFVRELRFGEQEFAAKKAFCREHGLRYVLAKDVWDGESVEEQLAAQSTQLEQRAVQAGRKPLTGPRRRGTAD